MLMYCLHKYTCTCTWKWTNLPLRGEKCWRFIAPLSRSESRWHHSTTPVIQNFACPRFPYLHVHGHNVMHVHGKNILSMALMAHVKCFKAYWGQFFANSDGPTYLLTSRSDAYDHPNWQFLRLVHVHVHVPCACIYGICTNLHRLLGTHLHGTCTCTV